MNAYTHIVYLNTPLALILQRIKGDKSRKRHLFSIAHLDRWQKEEEIQLRRLCYEHHILFSVLQNQDNVLDKLTILINDFSIHTEQHNMQVAEDMLDAQILSGMKDNVETVLVLDADKTLAAVDASKEFWRILNKSDVNKSAVLFEADPPREVFGSKLGYSYTAFRQAMLLYEEVTDIDDFEAICEKVASQIYLFPSIAKLLKTVLASDHMTAVVVTCGLRLVWEKVLQKAGFSDKIRVIGGGRISDGFVVTADVKTALVSRLQEHHKMHVFAFGDSPLDLGMLAKADHATVVVCKEDIRSKAMNLEFLQPIDQERRS